MHRHLCLFGCSHRGGIGLMETAIFKFEILTLIQFIKEAYLFIILYIVY